MSRDETIVKIDDAAHLLEKVMAELNKMGATHSMVSRVENLVRQLDDLQFDVSQCNLLNEGE